MTAKEIQQEITDLPILADFGDFLSYLQSHRVKLTAKGNIGPKDCFEINQMLYHSKEVKHNKTHHPKYSAIWLFFHLANEMRLTIVQKEKSSFYLSIEEESFEEFQTLNPVEQYFALLEAFWTKASLEELIANDRGSNAYENLNMELEELLEQGVVVGKSYEDHLYTLLEQLMKHLAFFGWWDAKERKASSNYTYINEIKIRPLGAVLIPEICKQRPLLYWNKYARLEEAFLYETVIFFKQEREDISEEEIEMELKRVKDELFILPFQQLFEEGVLEKSFSLKGAIEGNYTFVVSLSNTIWRKIKVSSQMTLEDLHLAIQKAYGFANDHLYGFFPSGKPYQGVAFYDIRGGEPPFASSITIEEAQINIGDCWLYLFDFGDNWHFHTHLEDINSEEALVKAPKIIEKKGRSPKQYGY